jgi:DNA-binding transcriptional LysR family regulator
VARAVGVSVMPQLLVDDSDDTTRIVPLGHLLPPRQLGLYERADGYRGPAVALAAAAIRGGALQPA